MSEVQLMVGYAKDKITPPMGVHIPGYGAAPRPSTGIHDDLYAQAVAFQWGETRGILFNCDALGITSEGADQVRQKVAARVGVPAEAVYIACTHSHTAVYLGAPEDKGTPMDYYLGRTHQIFCDLAEEAFRDLLPTSMKMARGEVKGVGFIRRYLMADGSLRTNPGTGRPDIVRPDGIQDESLQLVRFQREGGKEIVLINFGTHPDVIGGSHYSADWPGFTSQFFNEAMENEVITVTLNGFGGDSNHLNRFLPKGTVQKGFDFSKRMARKVAGEALRVYDNAVALPAGPVCGYMKDAFIGKNPHEDWEVPIAEKIVALKVQKDADIPEELKVYKMSLKKASRILQNLRLPEKLVVTVFGLQVGNLAFIGMPAEPFSEIGINIKAGSKMDMTMCSCRTNGSVGYLPTRRAFEGAGYERDYTKYGPDCADEVTAAALAIISEMKLSEKEN